MRDFRCKQCNRLLAKVAEASRVEIKCPRCKTMNFYTKEIYITIEEKEEVEEKEKAEEKEEVEGKEEA